MNIGCDIVKNSRLENRNNRFISLILTPKEQEIYSKKGLNFFAGRFAAKEAIIKCTNKNYNYLDIEILNDKNGKPFCNINNVSISISHEEDYTIAVAISNEAK